MADKEEGGGGLIETIFSSIFAVVETVVKAVFSSAGKIINFTLWVIAAVIILPCVFVASQLYPLWQDWGEDF